ncbi:MAG TPA: hypothetical protein VF802_02845 [Candidatus Limnocylindrales bacterium]
MRITSTLDASVHRRLLAIAAAVALGAAACTGSGASTAPSDTASQAASSSGTSAPGGTCQTAPAPAADLPGWPAPGTVPSTSVFPVIVSSEQICGKNRFLFSFLDKANTPQAAPDRTATVAFFDLGRDPSKAVASATGTFLWAIQGSRGLYVANVEFTEAGQWGAEFTTAKAGGAPETVRVRFDVKPSGAPVPVGGKAPSVRTPTLADVGGDVAKISSDPKPRSAFYETSVDAALAAHKPFVLIFATPAFCTSGQCGPTLDIIKGVADAEPTMTFINVEPYKLTFANGHLQPVLDSGGNLQPVDATNAYGLLSEPWIFVVDRNGIVTASYEAIVGADELKAAVDAVK